MARILTRQGMKPWQTELILLSLREISKTHRKTRLPLQNNGVLPPRRTMTSDRSKGTRLSSRRLLGLSSRPVAVPRNYLYRLGSEKSVRLQTALTAITIIGMLVTVGASGCLSPTNTSTSSGGITLAAEPSGGSWKPFVLNASDAIRSTPRLRESQRNSPEMSTS